MKKGAAELTCSGKWYGKKLQLRLVWPLAFMGRTKCGELRERVRHVRGTKDPITMLRFLRARQGSRQLKEVALEVGFSSNNMLFSCYFCVGGGQKKPEVAAMTAVWFPYEASKVLILPPRCTKLP